MHFEELQTQQFKCSVFQKVFVSERELEEHSIVHSKRLLKCGCCDVALAIIAT